MIFMSGGGERKRWIASENFIIKKVFDIGKMACFLQ